MGERQERIARACDLTVIKCIDYRLRDHVDGIDPFIQERFGTPGGKMIQYDPITRAGGCCSLARRDPATLETVEKDLLTSIAKHSTETVLIIQHTDCAGYESVFAELPSAMSEEQVLYTDLLDTIGWVQETLRRAGRRAEVIGFIAELDSHRVTGLRKVFPEPSPDSRPMNIRTLKKSQRDMTPRSNV